MKLIFYKAWYNPRATFFDKVIAFFSLGSVSHSEICFSNGECFSISPRENSIRFKKIPLNPQRWDIVELNISLRDEMKVYKYCKKIEQKKVKYDYIGALTSPLRLCIQNEDKYFCSEVCANVLSETEIFDLEKGCRYTPSRLQKTIRKLIKDKNDSR